MAVMILILLAVIAGEMGWLVRKLGHETTTPPAEREPESTEFEKRWREGLDAMMGYDLKAARGAVRRDEDESI